ncbi:MAG: leucyl/phenylalanyl-tRNA--protein transferase [Alphaproteobacteria bacterium]
MSSQADDIVAVGGSLDPDTLLRAYRRGIFPWPTEGLPLLWFCPRERAILDFAEIHLSRSLLRERRRSTLRFTIDHDFAAVIRACAAVPRPGQDGTWITPEMERAYLRLHRLGIAHSAEAWDGDELVGGIYGVDADGAFSAESMFHARPWASKLALLHLLDHLRSRGLDWIDIQVMTPHMERMGARLVARPAFLLRLEQTRKRGLDTFD